MGYWAKDGSYVREEDDAKPLSQREIWDEQDKMAARMKEEEIKRLKKEEEEKTLRVEIADMDRKIAEQKSNKWKNSINKKKKKNIILILLYGLKNHEI